MELTGSDFTSTFRTLAQLKKDAINNDEVVKKLVALAGPKMFFLKKHKN